VTRPVPATSIAAVGPVSPADHALIERFGDALLLEDGLSRNTLDAYRRDLGLLAAWLLRDRASSLASATEADLRAYIALRHPGSKATSGNRRLSTYRRFYRMLARERIRPDDPTLTLRAARAPARFPTTLSESQVEALLAAPDASTALGLRDRAMLETLYATGLRVSELVGLPTVSVGLNEGVCAWSARATRNGSYRWEGRPRAGSWRICARHAPSCSVRAHATRCSSRSAGAR